MILFLVRWGWDKSPARYSSTNFYYLVTMSCNLGLILLVFSYSEFSISTYYLCSKTLLNWWINTRMTKEDKEKQKIDLIIHKGYEGSHFDYLGHSSVKFDQKLLHLRFNQKLTFINQIYPSFFRNGWCRNLLYYIINLYCFFYFEFTFLL